MFYPSDIKTQQDLESILRNAGADSNWLYDQTDVSDELLKNLPAEQPVQQQSFQQNFLGATPQIQQQAIQPNSAQAAQQMAGKGAQASEAMAQQGQQQLQEAIQGNAKIDAQLQQNKSALDQAMQRALQEKQQGSGLGSLLSIAGMIWGDGAGAAGAGNAFKSYIPF